MKQNFYDLWATQTVLGNKYDMSAMALGKILEASGLKEGRQPTKKAVKEGYCRYTETEEGWPRWMWHVPKVSNLMNQTGASQLSEQEQEARRIARKLLAFEMASDEINSTAYKCWEGLAYDTARSLRPVVNHYLEQAGAYRLVNPHG